MALRFLSFAALNALALLAAASLATRARLFGRVEFALATSILWNFVVLVPIHLLGVAGRLSPAPLAAASVVISTAIIAACVHGEARRERAKEVWDNLVGAIRLPLDAAVACTSASSVSVVGVVAAAALIAWSAWQSWLLPSDGWDGIWYHETMVGYAIQNHGYSPVSLPMDLTQQANGYPRSCEMTNLWFVIFTDRRLIEVVNAVMAVPLVAAAYCVTRRFLADRAAAIGWACALILVPGVALQLRSTYIDVHVAALLLASIHFCTRPDLRLSDGWLAAVALALLIGAKSMALAWVPVLAVYVAARLFYRHGRARPLAALGVVLGGAGLILGVAALTYVRNWIHFKNPLWPIAYESARLGVRWPGVQSLARMDVNQPARAVYRAATAVPVPGHDFVDTRVFGYGFAVPIVLLPLAALGLLVGLAAGAAALVRRARGATSAEDARTASFLTVSAFVLYTSLVSPALWSARYNVQLVAGVFWAVAYLSQALAGRRIGDGLAGFAIVANLASCAWLDPPLGGAGVRFTLAAAARSSAERAAYAAADWTMPAPVALARERELGPGSVVVWSDDMNFPAVLWNERYSNRVVYVPPKLAAASLRKRIDDLGAKWLVTRDRGPLWSVVETGEWEEIGLACRGTKAFRRKHTGR